MSLSDHEISDTAVQTSHAEPATATATGLTGTIPDLQPSWPSPPPSDLAQLASHHVEDSIFPEAAAGEDLPPTRRSGVRSFTTISAPLEDEAEPSHPSLSPREAQIAGLNMDQDGHTYIHGPSSMMHRGRSGKWSGKSAVDTQSSQAATKARLISYAVVQRQSESYIYQNQPASMDLDGVDVELAKHLIDLHWNRQHFAYLLTYRPAVMESGATSCFSAPCTTPAAYTVTGNVSGHHRMICKVLGTGFIRDSECYWWTKL